MRARYRRSLERAQFGDPGKVFEYTIDLWSTSHVFLAGHRIRVDILSSNFPRFDRNLKTEEDQAMSVRMVKARQTIYHDATHPSHILLPAIPSETSKIASSRFQ